MRGLDELHLKRFWFSIWILIFFIAFQATFTFAQAGKIQNITLVVPETGISDLIKSNLDGNIKFFWQRLFRFFPDQID